MAATIEANEAIDLVTLADVKSWLTGTPSDVDDQILQMCITAWSTEFLRRTSRGDQNGDYLTSPFVAPVAYNETYDGAGYYRIFVRNYPIKSVTAVIVNNVTLQQSTGITVAGYVIDGSGRSIALRGGLLGIGNQLGVAMQAGPYRALIQRGFPFGIQNINIQYTAGFSSTPYDIAQCALKVVVLNYKRRSWVDEASRAMAGGGGTIRYRDWDIPPECERTVFDYSRTL